MASYINVLKDQQQTIYGPPPPASPRISFSSDLPSEAQTPPRPISIPDPNFEFSVGVRPMMAADELFFKGRMVPLSSGPSAKVRTLRDELRAFDYDPQPMGFKGWKGLLGFKRVNNGPEAQKKDKCENTIITTDMEELCGKIWEGSENREKTGL